MKNSGVYIYKLVLPEPINSQNEESKQFLHSLCSPPTGKTALLQVVKIQLLSFHNDPATAAQPQVSVATFWYYLQLPKNYKLPLPLAEASISYMLVNVTTHTKN